MHTLKPASTCSTTGSTSSKTAAWSDDGPKQKSKAKRFDPSLPASITSPPSAVTLTTGAGPSLGASGRTRHMTRIDPLSSCSWSCSWRRLRSSACHPATAWSRAGSTDAAARCIARCRYSLAISSTGTPALSIAAESNPSCPTQNVSSPSAICTSSSESPALCASSLCRAAICASNAASSSARTSDAGGGTGSSARCAAAASAAAFSSAAACTCASSSATRFLVCWCAASDCASLALVAALACCSSHSCCAARAFSSVLACTSIFKFWMAVSFSSIILRCSLRWVAEARGA